MKSPTLALLAATSLASFLTGCGPSKSEIEAKMQNALKGHRIVHVTSMEEVPEEQETKIEVSTSGGAISVKEAANLKRYVVKGEFENLIDSYGSYTAAKKFKKMEDSVLDAAINDAASRKQENLNAYSKAEQLIKSLSRSKVAALKDEVRAVSRCEPSVDGGDVSADLKTINALCDIAFNLNYKYVTEPIFFREKIQPLMKRRDEIKQEIKDCFASARDADEIGELRTSAMARVEKDVASVETALLEKLGNAERGQLIQPEIVYLKKEKGAREPFEIRVVSSTQGGKTVFRRDFKAEGFGGALAQLGAAFDAINNGDALNAAIKSPGDGEAGIENTQWSSGLEIYGPKKDEYILGSPGPRPVSR